MSAGGVIELKSPVSQAAMRGSLVESGRLQCSRPLSDADCNQLDAFLQAHPGMFLRIYRAPDSNHEFDFSQLAKVPALRNLWIDANAGDLNDLGPLEHLPRELKSLTLDTLAAYSDKTKDKAKQNAAVLSRLHALEELTVCGRLKALDFLASLPSLKRLQLWRCKLPSLTGIESMTGLQHLTLRATGAKDLDPVRGAADLKSLEIWDQRNMSDLSPVLGLKHLQRLWLISCGKTLPLPSFESLVSLKVLVIDNLVTAGNLHLIAAASSLRCLILRGNPSMASVAALAPLAGHPALKEVRLETFDEKLYKAIRDQYGWKVEYCNFPADEYLN
ncbi:MAG: hypothetical protein JNM76_01640 [Betaproteobacteria bacterium]|nr:hypothetical protein [Betaproteobacteria bacterium]